ARAGAGNAAAKARNRSLSRSSATNGWRIGWSMTKGRTGRFGSVMVPGRSTQPVDTDRLRRLQVGEAVAVEGEAAVGDHAVGQSLIGDRLHDQSKRCRSDTTAGEVGDAAGRDLDAPGDRIAGKIV